MDLQSDVSLGCFMRRAVSVLFYLVCSSLGSAGKNGMVYPNDMTLKQLFEATTLILP